MGREPLHARVEAVLKKKGLQHWKSPDKGNGRFDLSAQVTDTLWDLMITTDEAGQRLRCSYYPFDYVPETIRSTEEQLSFKGALTTNVILSGHVNLQCLYIGGDHEPSEEEITLVIDQVLQLGEEYKVRVAAAIDSVEREDVEETRREGDITSRF